jgi:hypothetical protein
LTPLGAESLELSACGTGRTVNNPMMIGKEVPSERRRRKEEVFPGNKDRARVENRKADRPKPASAKPTVVARCLILGLA